MSEEKLRKKICLDCGIETEVRNLSFGWRVKAYVCRNRKLCAARQNTFVGWLRFLYEWFYFKTMK